MKVSIVTISYNQAQYVEETLLSILRQDFGNIEYIVVDAGSTDGSREIIEKHRSRIAKVIFEPDEGPADGLNKGLQIATGDIYGFVNADDKLLPGSVSAVVRAFTKHVSTDIVYGHGYIIDAENKVIRKLYSDPYNLRRLTYGCVTFIQPSVFFRREAFCSVGGFNKLNSTCWDGEIMIDFGVHGMKFILIDEFLSAFRVHPLSFGSSGVGSPYRLALREDVERIFRKGVGRNRVWYDPLIKTVCRIEKWMLNPRGFFYNVGRVIKLSSEKPLVE
jgi:glycosyltransferase involved in cell wall biosynthesis